MGRMCLLNFLRDLIFFKHKNTNLPLPVAPTVIRRGTWLSGVLYYAHKFDIVKSVVGQKRCFINRDPLKSIKRQKWKK